MARLDAGIGMLLEELEKSGRLDNTLVLYIGDHGAQFSRGKCSVYEAGTRIPFLVSGHGKAGQVREELISTVDILPTVLAAAGVTVPAGLPGRKLQPLLAGASPAWRKLLPSITTGSSPGLGYLQFGLRGERWKLIHSPKGQGENRFAAAYLHQSNPHFAAGTRPEEIREKAAYERFLNPPEYELYDLKSDPHEFRDLAAEQPGELKRMVAALRAWQESVGDPFLQAGNTAFFLREQVEAIGTRYKGTGKPWAYLERFSTARRGAVSTKP